MNTTSKVSLEDQIEVLASCGITLNSGITIDHLLTSFDRGTYESNPYKLLVAMMGGPLELGTENGKDVLISNNLWHMDTECIYDIGDYAHIAERMSILAGNVLKLTDISDHFYRPLPIARLCFYLKNKKYNWFFFLRGDWVDPRIFSKFQKLLRKENTEKHLCSLDTGGSDIAFAFLTQAQQRNIRKLTGLNFEE